MEITEYSVSEIAKEIKNIFENKYFYIKIRGEISGFKKHSSGTFYFSLKDENAIVNAVMFSNSTQYCNLNLEDGIEVIAIGRLSIYKERSTYQLIVEGISLYGIGSLLKIISERKERLEKEGLFDIKRKKNIPTMPRSVAIITAEDGAALQDILIRLKERTPINLILYSVMMQGKNSANQIIEALNYFNQLRKKPQLIVLTRGGGSVEDLMSFNEENLVRCVASSKIPIITAIGHEIDWTLVDYASDLRLPTPTSVAEYLTISKEQANKDLNILSKRLYSYLSKNYQKKLLKLNNTFFIFLKNKCSLYIQNKYFFYSYILKLENIFKIKIQNYKFKKQKLFKININLIIKNKIIKNNQLLELFNLKLEKYYKKFPILRNLNNDIIYFKKEIITNSTYILEFSDGKIEIKI